MASRDYMSNSLDIPVATVKRILKTLLDKGLIERGKLRGSLRTTDSWNKTKDPDVKALYQNDTLSIKMIPDKDQNDTGDGIKMIPHYINNNNSDSNTIDDPKKIPFDDFWSLYDKKTSDKHATKKKWEKLSRENQEAAMEYIPKYKEAQPEKQYRKNPDTWINQRGWEHELIYRTETPKTGSDLKPKATPINYDGLKDMEDKYG